MPGYKLYQNDTLMGVVPLPRLGSSNPAYIRVRVKREGFGHPLPAPPYVGRNQYTAEHSRVIRYGQFFSGGKLTSVVINADTANFPRIPPLPQPHLNAVYGKFRTEVFGEQASLGIAVAQWRQSWGMIANRAYQLARAAKQLYRGRFREFLSTLGISKPKGKHLRKKWSRPREAAGLWLEYSFGWKPLAGDIFSAFQQLQEPIPVDTYAASRSIVLTSKPGPDTWVSRVLTTQRADVLLTNPNLFLAAQLGLVNIGDVIFDGIPFSFVLDWFTDCQLWIQSHTDWVGLRVENPAISNKAETNFFFTSGLGGRKPCLVARSAFTRKLGMIKPLPNLDILSNIGKSKTRGANAMSLLVQVLSKY